MGQRRADHGRLRRGARAECLAENRDAFLEGRFLNPVMRRRWRARYLLIAGLDKFRIDARQIKACKHALGDNRAAQHFELGLDEQFFFRRHALRFDTDPRTIDVLVANPHEQAGMGLIFLGHLEGDKKTNQENRDEDRNHQPLCAPQLEDEFGRAHPRARSHWHGLRLRPAP